MSGTRRVHLMIACVLAMLGGIGAVELQAAQQPAGQEGAGLETPWEAQKILDTVIKDNEKLKSLLNQMNPQSWYDKKGAPGLYIEQWAQARQQVDDFSRVSAMVAKKIDSLSQVIEAYFRLEALDVTTRSVTEGGYRYGDRTIADQMSALIAQNFGNRERLRGYIRELAASKEEDFKIADAEAQRCRGMISKERSSKPARK